MPIEVELKLSATPAAYAAVRRHRALADAKAGRARTTAIVSRYYDTPADELHQRGIALRLRRQGNRWLQTVEVAPRLRVLLHQANLNWTAGGLMLMALTSVEPPVAATIASANPCQLTTPELVRWKVPGMPRAIRRSRAGARWPVHVGLPS